eukprot:2634628-Rhodomonas_salina.1
MVVPLNTPVNAMKMITAKGVRSKHMKRIDPCPTCAIPAWIAQHAASAASADRGGQRSCIPAPGSGATLSVPDSAQRIGRTLPAPGTRRRALGTVQHPRHLAARYARSALDIAHPVRREGVPDTNCSHPAISPKKSPNAARTHNVKPPFSGKAVDSSAVIIAVGIDQRMPTIKIPRMALNGPAVCTIVSVPSGPPAIAKYVSATSDHSVTVLGT